MILTVCVWVCVGASVYVCARVTVGFFFMEAYWCHDVQKIGTS